MEHDTRPAFVGVEAFQGTVAPWAFKVGGSPELLARLDPPTCRQCGGRLSFLAQIPLREPLKLSQRFDRAYVFVCAGPDGNGSSCPINRTDLGANLVVFQSAGGPAGEWRHPVRFPEYGFRLAESDEPVIQRDAVDAEGDLLDRVSCETKIGGVPFWIDIDNDDTPSCPRCAGATEFLGQICSAIRLPEREDLYRTALDMLLTPEVRRLLARKYHVLVHVSSEGCRVEAVRPSPGRKPGLFTILGDPTELERSAKDHEEVFPFAEGWLGFVYRCAKECSDSGGAFVCQLF